MASYLSLLVCTAVSYLLIFHFSFQIRKQAIKDLPKLCIDKEHTKRIADILAQMLQATDSTELSVVHNSIMTLFKQDPKGKRKVEKAVFPEHLLYYFLLFGFKYFGIFPFSV